MSEKERDETHVEQHGDGDVNVTVEENDDSNDEQVESKEEE